MEVTNFYNYGTMNEVEAGATQINYYYGNVSDKGKVQDGLVPCAEVLADAIRSVQSFMWGKSAYAVLFCVCRDEYGMGDNMSQFEEDLRSMGFECPDGTISSAFYNNPYLKMRSDRWEANGAKPRTRLLADKFKEAVDRGLQAECSPKP